MSACSHDLHLDGDDVVCSKCGERRDAITGATIPSAPAVTAQQSAEVEALETLRRLAAKWIPQADYQEALAAHRALAQRIETLTRERDEVELSRDRISDQSVINRLRAEDAEAQRDRLAEALREADNGLAKIERQNYTGTWREIVEQHSRAAGEIRDRIAALSEIEQAASNYHITQSATTGGDAPPTSGKVS